MRRRTEIMPSLARNARGRAKSRRIGRSCRSQEGERDAMKTVIFDIRMAAHAASGEHPVAFSG